MICAANFTPGRRFNKQRALYPLQVHHMIRDRLLKSDKPKIEGVWSSWSPWTPCSRSCGTGVTQQIRHCVSKSFQNSTRRENKGRKRRKRKLDNHCVGLYKRFHVCNTQKCPYGQDFRFQQCAHFNKYPFKGRYYFWEPFLKAGNECALNCRPLSLSFYATLNKTVVDGTPCLHPITSTGKAAPFGSQGLCVEGRCKSVASNGVIGSIDDLPEDCAACLKGSCRSVSGLYTKPDLPQGYSLIAQIPRGACRIIVQQLKHTKNNIALRNANGSYIINGEWKFGPSRTYEGAGTQFVYRKQDATSLETVSTTGPISNPIDIMIVTQQPNFGVKYGYSVPFETESKEHIAPPFMKRPVSISTLEPRRLDVPIGAASQHDEAITVNNNHKRRARRRFIWKVSGVSTCTKSCGGGIQTTTYSCIREHTQISVSDKRCSHLEKPVHQQIRCNMQPCPAQWVGVWGPCAGSCGQGVQNYVLYCQQANSAGQLMILSDTACLEAKPQGSSRPCKLPSCTNEPDNEVHQTREDSVLSTEDWAVGTWTQCSVSCGTGQRTRSVTCTTGKCNVEKRPAHAEYCDSGICSLNGRISPWLVSEWSQCSEACGTGTQSRLTICNKDLCDPNTKPEVTRACSTDRYCVGQWFSGPWGACSESCTSQSKQIRSVFCIIKARGQSRITNEMTCSIQEKPVTERLCHGICPAKWFFGEWSGCDGKCPVRSQARDVVCKDAAGGDSNLCNENERPESKRPCSCEKHDLMNQLAQDEPQDSNCVDKVPNCYMAVQARLCQYNYYTNSCCVSCSKSPQHIVD